MTELYEWDVVKERIVIWENQSFEDEFELELEYEDYMDDEEDVVIFLPEDDGLLWLEMSYSRLDIWDWWDDENYEKTEWELFLERR